jgi:hypothetical protein
MTSHNSLSKLFLVFSLFLSLSVACSKSSSIEGRVVDSHDKPVTNVLVKAIHDQHLKGYEPETRTDNNGEFHLDGLYPQSNYTLLVKSNNFPGKIEQRITSAPDGQTSVLDKPLRINRVQEQIKISDKPKRVKLTTAQKKEAQEAIGSVLAAAKVYHAETGNWPDDIRQLEQHNLINFDQVVTDRWDLAVKKDQYGNIKSIIATLRANPMNIVTYDSRTGEWSIQ